MKRDEALSELAAQAQMEILNDVLPKVAAGSVLYPGIWGGIVRKAVYAAYRRGEEDMRERAATFLEDAARELAKVALPLSLRVDMRYVASDVERMEARAAAIRALPLTEESDEQKREDSQPETPT